MGLFDSISSGFVGLGNAISEGAGKLINQTPTNTNTFSFDFSGAVKKMLEPFQNKSNPILDAFKTAGTNLAKVGISVAESKIEDIFRNSTKKPEVSSQLVSTANNAIPSQTNSNLSDILSILNSWKPANVAAAGDSVVAASNSVNNVLIVGGAVLVITLLTLSKR